MKNEPLSGNHADEIRNENAAIHKIENNFKERKKGDYYLLQNADIEWWMEEGEAESITEYLDMQEIIDHDTYEMIAIIYNVQIIQVALLDIQRRYGKG